MPQVEVPAVRTTLSGWGRSSPSGAELVIPPNEQSVAQVLTDASPRAVLARGLGRSYGDAAQNAGGHVLDMTVLDGIQAFDPDTGVLVAQAGLSLHEVMRRLLPFGWFPPVTPGTRYVTLGGALAADVHGKNHHVDGSFGQYVSAFWLSTPQGERHVTQESDPQLYWATVGGMGLTGVITRMELQLRPVRSSWMRVWTERGKDLSAVFEAMERADSRYPYSVAWLDLLARGRGLGRGVLTCGEHADAGDIPPVARREPLRFDARPLVSVPPGLPSGLVNGLTVRALNEATYRRAPRTPRDDVQPIAQFFHPLDGIANWNRVYGPRGFCQYQFVVPYGREEVVAHVVERLGRLALTPSLAVLKRFGPANPGPLSFPMAGWTLAVDIPLGPRRLASVLRGFDRRVAEAGGRVYLAKDARLDREFVPAMYPRLDEWRAARIPVDPHGRISSDLDRRLNLTGSHP